ncbi:hypothetical protein [Plantactinospora sonchi]|uniref:23S rRNA (Guanosine(2251)-2'-O)-methyltransferase RlmB n=1 Tax=Plantactinospora sonchi TaxID=1544735 RepID=A0ABU7RKJ4_9ACTN
MGKASGKRRQGQRGAAEERSGAPLTSAEKKANQRSPGRPDGPAGDARAEGFAESQIGERAGGDRDQG